jgi:hypothetical protein
VYKNKYFKTRIKKITKTLADGSTKESYIAQVDMLFFWEDLEEYNYSYEFYASGNSGEKRHTLEGEKAYIDYVISHNESYKKSRVVDKKFEYIEYL